MHTVCKCSQLSEYTFKFSTEKHKLQRYEKKNPKVWLLLEVGTNKRKGKRYILTFFGYLRHRHSLNCEVFFPQDTEADTSVSV